MRLSILLAMLACQAYAIPSDTSILKILERKKTATVIIDVTGSNVESIRNKVSKISFTTRAEKITSMRTALKEHADTTQVKILSFLDQERKVKSLKTEQIWVLNKIIVRNADYGLVKKLLAMEEVAGVREEMVFQLIEPVEEYAISDDNSTSPPEASWGVTQIGAHKAHDAGYFGEGVYVGVIDTGIKSSHVLFSQQDDATAAMDPDPNYSWYDPINNSPNPSDSQGHGTHVCGTIAGRNGMIGVAPKSKLIVCQGCPGAGCMESALLECGQYMFCPTDTDGNNADCSKAPRIVSNSWGGPESMLKNFEPMIDTWKEAEIIPVFAAGNSGSSCGTTLAPAASPDVIAVGASDNTDAPCWFSSRGPTKAGLIKPDISAPGMGIMSAGINSDTAYKTNSGTSMACPHVSGLIALLLSVKPDLTYDDIKYALYSDATKSVQPPSETIESCGDTIASDDPNNILGHGIINVMRSIEIVEGMQ